MKCAFQVNEVTTAFNRFSIVGERALRYKSDNLSRFNRSLTKRLTKLPPCNVSFGPGSVADIFLPEPMNKDASVHEF